jgi:tripartite-type tricarboxylate transporter receptor subunit TctC
MAMKPTSKPKPVARKKSTPAPMPVKPKAKPKTLNDFLKEGKRPPSKNKKLPSEADVIIKGYNDKKSLSKPKRIIK